MNEWINIYNKNKRLDDIFKEKYGKDPYYHQKNSIELLTELGELANETKCFKYWSIKKPYHEEILEEYADCIMMVLYFYNYMNLEIKELPIIDNDKDILQTFNYLFEQSSKIMNNCNSKLIIDIFANLIHLGVLLELTEEEIYNICYKKIEKVEERLNSDY